MNTLKGRAVVDSGCDYNIGTVQHQSLSTPIRKLGLRVDCANCDIPNNEEHTGAAQSQLDVYLLNGSAGSILAPRPERNCYTEARRRREEKN